MFYLNKLKSSLIKCNNLYIFNLTITIHVNFKLIKLHCLMAEKLSVSDEQLREEFETLDSIYQDDANFTVKGDQSITYKFVFPDAKDFIVQFDFPPTYPEDPPNIHMELMYNTKLRTEEKDAIITALSSEAEDLIGVQMMYSLLEWGKENLNDVVDEFSTETADTASAENHTSVKKPVKKEHLSKAAKRKLADNTDAKGEKPRGWNWVDVIKHLSKTAPSVSESKPP